MPGSGCVKYHVRNGVAPVDREVLWLKQEVGGEAGHGVVRDVGVGARDDAAGLEDADIFDAMEGLTKKKGSSEKPAGFSKTVVYLVVIAIGGIIFSVSFFVMSVWIASSLL